MPLRVASDQLSFGTVWEDEALDWTFAVTNEGADVIAVEEIGVSCNCTSITPSTFVLEPGSSIDLRLRINLTKTPQKDGGVFIVVSPRWQRRGESASQWVKWQLTGTVRRHLLAERRYQLGQHSDLATPLKPWTVALTSAEPLERLTVSSEVPELEAKLRPLDDSGTQFELTLLGRGNLTPRKIEGAIVFESVRKGGEALPMRRTQIDAEIVPDARLDHVEIIAGGRRQGELIEETIQLSSLTGLRQWVIEDVRTEGPGLSVERMGPSAVRVRQVVAGTGRQNHQVQVVAGAAGNRVTLTLPVTFVALDSAK